jgi:hypothetical protein
MLSKFKVLGLISLLALALGVIVASPASAANFTASKYPTSITASGAKGNDVIKTEGGNVECASHLSGTLSAASSSVTVTASYTECQAFGFSPATVAMGCDYVLNATETLDIECSASNKIIITAGTCEIQIGTQTGLSKVEHSNGSGDIDAKANVSGINYTVTKDGAGCPFNGTGAKTGATYIQTSSVTVSSTNGASVDIEFPPHGEYTAGGYPTTGTATSALGNDTLITAVGTQECTGHYVATLVESSPDLTVTPTISSCKFAGFNATVNMNGCDYKFTTPATEGTDAWLASMDIVCPAGKAITVTAGPCTYTIGAQGPLSNVTIQNDTAAGDMTTDIGIVNQINYTVTVDNFGCPFAGTGPKTGASLIQHNPITFDSTNGQSIHIG